MKIKTRVKAGASFTVGKYMLEVDEDGFIEEPEKWNNDVAKAL